MMGYPESLTDPSFAGSRPEGSPGKRCQVTKQGLIYYKLAKKKRVSTWMLPKCWLALEGFYIVVDLWKVRSLS